MKDQETKNGALNPREVELPKKAEFRIFRAMLEDLGVCSLDYKLHGALRERNVPKLLAAVTRYDARSIIDRLGESTSRNTETFYKLYQVGALLKKYPFKGIDTFTPALDVFREGERKCKLYNTQNFRALVSLSRKHPKYFGLLDELRAEILDLLGSKPPMDEIFHQAKHGPGQTADGPSKGGRVTEFYKYSVLPYAATSRAHDLAMHVIESDPQWIGALMDWYRTSKGIPMWAPISMEDFWNSVLTRCDYNEISSVPKTGLIDRFIALEPVLNVFLQLGVDGVIRHLLLERWGYNLNSQEWNQFLAELGSKTDRYATLDLKGASDGVSRMICFLLLPPEWYALLDDLRCPMGYIKKTDEFVRYSKMSSMGNGYTFVLESVIFGACVRVAQRRCEVTDKTAVYGDDLIVAKDVAPLLIEILELCGFELNLSKSFITGPFRESCGADFFLGKNVRPLFITSDVRDIRQLLHIHNSLYYRERNFGWATDLTFSVTLSRLRSWIPQHIAARCRGPISESTDTHLFCDEPLSKTKEGYRFFNYLRTSAQKFSHPGKLFLFRKLMHRPRTEDIQLDEYGFRVEAPVPKWDWRRKLNKGNAFDVTRRDRIIIRIARKVLPDRW